MNKNKWCIVVISFFLIVIAGVYIARIPQVPQLNKTFLTSEQYWSKKGTSTVPFLSHQQDVWLYVLEWCESRGVQDAINPKDKDGTPSYYSFQFKPQTFKEYSIKYKLLQPENLEGADYLNWMTEYHLTREIVKRMIFDPNVIWEREFPNCIKLHGRPPK